MSIKKRDSRQYIVINEERLISEVQQRPILYDRALKGYRKPTIRECAWQEVATMLESTVDESKKRWRSLRDAFMKQYKQYASDDPMCAKKKKWLFYDQMDFLRPFLEMTNELSLSRDDYMDEYMESTNTTTTTGVKVDDSDVSNTLNHIIKREEYFTTTADSKGNHLIIQHRSAVDTNDDQKTHYHQQHHLQQQQQSHQHQHDIDDHHHHLVDEDELHEEALDGSSDVGVNIGSGGDDVEEVEQLEEHEEVIDLYEERDIISEIFTTPGIATSSVDSVVGGGNEPQEELMQQPTTTVSLQHQQVEHVVQQQQQQQHIIVKGLSAVDQQTYQQQQQPQQLQSQLQPVTVSAAGLVQLATSNGLHNVIAASVSTASSTNVSNSGIATKIVLDDHKEPANHNQNLQSHQQTQNQQHQQQQQQQQHQQQQQQQQQQLQPQHHSQLDIATATVTPFGLDPDERFLLSCSPILKRMSHKKNALARLKMQQILYEIEFGSAELWNQPSLNEYEQGPTIYEYPEVEVEDTYP